MCRYRVSTELLCIPKVRYLSSITMLGRGEDLRAGVGGDLAGWGNRLMGEGKGRKEGSVR